MSVTGSPAKAGLKGGRQRKGRKAIEVVVAVERREKSLGRLRLEIIRDDGSETRYDFIKRNVEPGSLIVSDAWQGYSGIEPEIYDHQSVSQAAQKRAGGSPSAVPRVDRVTSNLKTWLRGTHHGVGADHLDAYLDEFTFRFNRRHNQAAGFATLLGLTTTVTHATAADITPLPREGEAKRRGRSTGQTGAVHRNPPLPPKGEKAPRRRRPKKPALTGTPEPA
jgi:ISXO2-like transposase domain